MATEKTMALRAAPRTPALSTEGPEGTERRADPGVILMRDEHGELQAVRVDRKRRRGYGQTSTAGRGAKRRVEAKLLKARREH